MLKCSEPSPIMPLHHIRKAVHLLSPVVFIPSLLRIFNSEIFYLFSSIHVVLHNVMWLCVIFCASWWRLTVKKYKEYLVADLYLVHTADTDKTKLSCLVLSVSAVWTQQQTRLRQLQIGNWVETRQNLSKLGRDKTKLSCLVCSGVHTVGADKTRQFCLVRVGGMNKLLQT